MMTTQERYGAVPDALDNKPALDQPCNNCGWCCLTETCDLGLQFYQHGDTVCRMLVPKDGKYFCKLASTKAFAEHLHIGRGCNAISVREKMVLLEHMLA